MTTRTRRRPRRVAVIGVPMDLGSNLRGVDMGPSAIRIAGAVERIRELGCQTRDLGNMPVPHASVAGVGSAKLRYAEPIRLTCKKLAGVILGAKVSGFKPVVLGGDHSIAIGTLAGLVRYGRKGRTGRRKRWGLLWVDAHADSNSPRSTPSGNVHGMPLAAVLGLGDRTFTHLAGAPPMVDPSNAVLFGVRDIDGPERDNIRKLGFRVMTMREIDERGAFDAMQEALDIITSGTDGFHLSFDIDSLDPRLAPGVGTPVPGGLTVREAHLIMELVADSGRMVSCEVVEVNPVIDHGNATAELAAGLIHSVLGGKIL